MLANPAESVVVKIIVFDSRHKLEDYHKKKVKTVSAKNEFFSAETALICMNQLFLLATRSGRSILHESDRNSLRSAAAINFDLNRIAELFLIEETI